MVFVTPSQLAALWAVYYAWYQTGDDPHGKSRMWMVDDADRTPRSRAHPLIGPYDSDDPEVARWHIRLAKSAGIDAFLVSWWGGANISGKAFEKTILPVAAQENFHVAICCELAQFHHDVKALARQARAAGKRVFLPAHPGHDNSGFRPDDFFVIPRDDGATLRGYLRAITDANADVALLTSFNEWPETTVVEPSSSWPDPQDEKIARRARRRVARGPTLPLVTRARP